MGAVAAVIDDGADSSDEAEVWAHERARERRLRTDAEMAEASLRRSSGLCNGSGAVAVTALAGLAVMGVLWLFGLRLPADRSGPVSGLLVLLVVVFGAGWLFLMPEVGSARYRAVRAREDLRFLLDVRAYREAGGEPAPEWDGAP